MRQAPASVLAKVPHLPETPGVYLWKDAEGKVRPGVGCKDRDQALQ